MSAPRLQPGALEQAYQALLAVFGPQGWWPGEPGFETMAGAILVQNTAWRNVERAIANLRTAGLLDPAAMLAASPEALAAAIRPAGYFNVKAQRLRHFCAAYLEAGGCAALSGWETAVLRRWLLGIKGIGPETADDILLYVYRRPVFVIDAYTRRVFSRLGWVRGDEPYEQLRGAVEAALGPDEPTFNEYHALLVALGKDYCRPTPRCTGCPLSAHCQY